MKKFMLIVILLTRLISGSVVASTNQHWQCEVNADSFLSGAVEHWNAEWDEAHNTWFNLPTDLGLVPIDLIYTDKDRNSGAYEMFSKTDKTLWRWIFYNFDPDENGGTHHFCPDVVIFDLTTEDW